METMQGGCHCGRVEFKVRGDVTADTVLECNCSLCSMKGILHWIVDRQLFELLSGEKALTTYQFNTETAEHYFCETCGVQSFYRPRSHPDGISVNARCLEGIQIDGLSVEQFDGRNWKKAIEELKGR